MSQELGVLALDRNRHSCSGSMLAAAQAAMRGTVGGSPVKKMSFPDRRTANILLTILLLAVVFAILYAARRVLLIFVFAILFAYLIDPVVRFLQRHSLFFKNLRGPHVVEAYLAFLILLALLTHGVALRLPKHADEFFENAPTLLDGLSTGEFATTVGDKYGWTEAQELRLKVLLVRNRDQIQGLAQRAKQFTSNAVVVLVVVPILAIFFLADGGRIAEAFIQLTPTEENRQAIRELADDLNVMLRKYIRAKVILGVCSLVFYSGTMLLLRFPHAIGLGFLGGVLEFMPVAGWMVSALTIIGAGILTHGHWIWMAVLLSTWRMAMDYFISPRVLGQNLEVHPLLVIFAMMVGAEIGGIVGIYLSIPLMVVIRVIWRKYFSPTPRVTPELLHPGDNLRFTQIS